MSISQEIRRGDPDKKNGEPSEEDRLSLNERNTVQIEIMKKMLESGTVRTELEWAENYSEPISDIIDNPQNTEIRKLIRGGDKDATKYDEASDLIISLLLDVLIKKAA